MDHEVQHNGRQIFTAVKQYERYLKFPETGPTPRPQDDGRTARAIVEGIPNDGVEHAFAVAYSSKMEPLAWTVLATGAVDMVPFAPREMYGWALTIPRARYIGVAHNHPSGDTTPSPPDKRCTMIAAGVGKALGIDMVYSLVVTHENDTWEEIPLVGKRAPKEPGEDEGKEPESNPDDPPEDEGEEPEEDPGDPGEDEQDPEESEGEDEGEGEGDPEVAPNHDDEDPTADLDELKNAIGRLVGRTK